MPIRRMTPEQAVEAISDAIREIRAAASTLEARLPDNSHQERAVRVMSYETDELASALPVLRGLVEFDAALDSVPPPAVVEES